jgi:hypothetical protein
MPSGISQTILTNKVRNKTVTSATSPKLLGETSMLTPNLPSNAITTSSIDAETVIHVPTVVFSTIVMELR